ncbi:class I SAM-dependent methyltransferase [Paraburkholderia hospita]|uniref:class I SAM-dependent methyltransferase n=1 Tax=Paraburkholderia hospita TaxID=169430 RepID=UPI003F508AA2
MSIKCWAPYDAASNCYFNAYESLEFLEVHRSLVPFLPKKGGSCLDVGAGSGRDAAALAKRGYRVTAVEPSTGLRALAERKHNIRNIRWVDDHLPRLSRVHAIHERYDFILLSAVWMHVRPEDRRRSMTSLATLLREGGHLAITFRTGSLDGTRELFDVRIAELIKLGRAQSLRPIYRSPVGNDLLRRANVSWQKVVLAKPR